MAYFLDRKEGFRISDTTDANGVRRIVYEQREYWVQASPPDSYWVVSTTARWQLVGGGNTAYPTANLRPENYLLPFSGALTLGNPITCVACSQGTHTVQLPDCSVNGSFVETVGASAFPGTQELHEPGAYEEPLVRQRLYDFLGEEVVEPSPPVVTLITPAEGVIDADTPIVIEVTDADDFSALIVVAEMPAVEIADLVHDGTEFKPAYVAGSTREAITDGWRYTILRRTAWPAAPTITVHPVDTLGAGSV